MKKKRHISHRNTMHRLIARSARRSFDTESSSIELARLRSTIERDRTAFCLLIADLQQELSNHLQLGVAPPPVTDSSGMQSRFGTDHVSLSLLRKLDTARIRMQSLVDSPVDRAATQAAQSEALALLRTAMTTSFQARVVPWANACCAGGPTTFADHAERLLQAAAEFDRANGLEATAAHAMVDAAYASRPAGDPVQKAGRVMLAMATSCHERGINMHAAADQELASAWAHIEGPGSRTAAGHAKVLGHGDRLSVPAC